jgi:hypothetical protein
MTAFNVVHFRVKPGCEEEFLALNRRPGHEVRSGLRHATLLKTGERSYSFLGEWDGFDKIVAARADMIADLDRMRHLLEDLGNGLGVTHAVAGEAIAELSNIGTFDYVGFKHAFEAQDVEAWLSFYDDAAEWIEYRHSAPPKSPNVMRGKPEIGAFLKRVKESNLKLELGDEVIGPNRGAFCVTCTLPDNDRKIIENVIVHFRDGRIARQVDVEAWD